MTSRGKGDEGATGGGGGDRFDLPGDYRGGQVNIKSTFHQPVYQVSAPPPVDEATLEAARERLTELPLDRVPEAGAPLPAGSRMPLGKNPLFVGREPDLRRLAEILKGDGSEGGCRTAAVAGLGGMGKTQLAASFVHRYGRYFAGGVFWLSFAEPASVAVEVAACGGPGALDLCPQFPHLPQPDQVRLVQAAWQSPLPRLLVFDNCEDEELLERWRPTTGGCRVLVTTRRPEWSLGLDVEPVPLGVFQRPESIALLREHRPDLAEDDEPLDAIADTLGDLPLALHLAGSYLARYRRSDLGRPETYLAALQSPDLLDHPSLTRGDRSPTGHEQHVAKTFALSWNRLDPGNPVDALAIDLLTRAACLAPGEPIPRELLHLLARAVGEGEGEEDDEDGAPAVDEAKFADALGRLVDELGLLDEEPDGRLVLHRLLGAFVRGTVPDLEPVREAVETAIVQEADRINQAGYPAPLASWQPHLRAVAESAAARESPTAGDLFNALGCHLDMVADFAGARDAYERALGICERAYGPDHPNVAIVVNNLGTVYGAQGRLEEARAAYERVLRIDERAYGPDHPEVAIDVNNLGGVYQAQGLLEEAREALERALRIDERAFGPDHPKVATDVNNLGGVYQAQARQEEAREAFERALGIDERAFGPDHPKVAIRVNNLGEVYRAQGRLEEAREAFERALGIDERAFGPDHPKVATRVNNLGTVYKAQGRMDEAREAYDRALEVLERFLGSDHPKTRLARENLETLASPEAKS